jgi:hypothetical protein
MRTQETKAVKGASKVSKPTRRKHNLKKNIKYHEGEEEFYKEYDDVDALDEFFSEPNYLEDYLD